MASRSKNRVEQSYEYLPKSKSRLFPWNLQSWNLRRKVYRLLFPLLQDESRLFYWTSRSVFNTDHICYITVNKGDFGFWLQNRPITGVASLQFQMPKVAWEPRLFPQGVFSFRHLPKLVVFLPEQATFSFQHLHQVFAFQLQQRVFSCQHLHQQLALTFRHQHRWWAFSFPHLK